MISHYTISYACMIVQALGKINHVQEFVRARDFALGENRNLQRCLDCWCSILILFLGGFNFYNENKRLVQKLETDQTKNKIIRQRITITGSCCFHSCFCPSTSNYKLLESKNYILPSFIFRDTTQHIYNQYGQDFDQSEQVLTLSHQCGQSFLLIKY